ncbi:hypothetical protein [Salinifilum aidingensis]
MPRPNEAMRLVEAMWWRPVHENDPAHAWLRSASAEAAQQIDTGGESPQGAR